MKAVVWKGCVAAGALLVLAALGLFLYNGHRRIEAEEAATAVAAELTQVIREGTAQPEQQPPDMAEAEVGGYIGILSIPALALELPVQADWDYEKLQTAPCRYSGSIAGGLVVMAHNYPGHFGKIAALSEGDAVAFTDVGGRVIRYAVARTQVLDPEDVEKMTAGEYGLTLFTCTYGGKNRIAVRCRRVEE